MSTASTTSTVRPVDSATKPIAWSADRSRLADYVELAKPRISVMVLITVSVGYAVGAQGQWNLVPLLHALLGIGLVATASSCLNQFIERRTDARMLRTADRPIPSGRLTPGEVLLFGTFCGVFGTLWLITFVNPLTALLTAATLGLYVFAYTPMKRHTSLCTAVGAIPGALPPSWDGRPRAARSTGVPFRCLRFCSCGSFRTFWRSLGCIRISTGWPA